MILSSITQNSDTQNNSIILYLRKANKVFNLWIESLHEPMKSHFLKMGLDKCKGVLNFTRFQLELKDNGLDEYLKEKLTSTELQFWKSHGK